MKKNFLFGSLLLLVITGCGSKKGGTDSEAALPIEVAYPYIQDVTLTKDYPGYLSADASVALVGRVNGTLQATKFNPGERVKKGQLLFIIEPTLYEDAVKQAEASLKTAQAELSYARSNYSRMQEAIKSDAISRINFLEAEANVAEYEASVSNAEAALRTAKTDLSYCYVRAPYDGQMNRAVYSVGAYIAGAASPVTLAKIYKDDRMYSYFNISDNQWLAQMISNELTQFSTQVPHYVTIRLGQEGTQQWQAKLDYLSPNISMTTGTLEVRAELENPNGLLKEGSYISVTLPYGEVKNAIIIPDASIGTDQLGKYIYVVNSSNVVSYRPIVAGQLVNDSLRLVKSGLAPDERFVTKALLKVHQGMHITPVERPSVSARQNANR